MTWTNNIHSMEEEKIVINKEKPINKKKRINQREKIESMVRKALSYNACDVYADVIEENKRLKEDLNKARNLLVSVQREYDDFRESLIENRFMNVETD